MSQIVTRVKAVVATVADRLKNLTAPKSAGDIIAALYKQVEQLERVRERSLKRIDEINLRIDALYDERDRLEAEAAMAWRTAKNLMSILEN